MSHSQIFNLVPQQLEQAHVLIKEMKEKNLSIIPFRTTAINVYIVKDGTQEAHDRKNLILGPIQFENEQYLITLH